MKHVRERTCSARRPFVSQGLVVTNPTTVHPTAARRMVEVGVPYTTHQESAMCPLVHLLLHLVATCALFHPTRSATVALEGILGAARLRRPVSSKGTLPQVNYIIAFVHRIATYHSFSAPSCTHHSHSFNFTRHV